LKSSSSIYGVAARQVYVFSRKARFKKSPIFGWGFLRLAISKKKVSHGVYQITAPPGGFFLHRTSYLTYNV
ncbi:hypothetical protein, partial [Vibrio parahaemolyticus]|uniref:hypothetical protein n=1 Tax=Vibrio parahaemolyticus TaxID=670 RepID=UPI0006C1D247